MYKYKEGDAMDNMEMVEAMQDMFITYLKPIQEKIEILGLQNKVIQNKLDNMDLRLASLEYQVKKGFNRMDQDIEILVDVMEAKDIVKTTVFIKEMNDFGKINEIYKKYFKEPFPARSCVEVARLPKDVLLEVEAIAWK